MKFLVFGILTVIIASPCAAVVPISEIFEGEIEVNNGIREITCLALFRITPQIPDVIAFCEDVRNTSANIHSHNRRCQETSGIQKPRCLMNLAKLISDEKKRIEKKITDQVASGRRVWYEIQEAHRVCLN